MTLTRQLAAKRRHGALVLWIERLGPALAPSAALLIGFVCLALLGLIARLPAAADLALLAATALAAIAAALTRLRAVRRPGATEIDAHLQQRDPHRSLTALGDRPAFAGAEAVWQAHRDQALARVPDLRVGAPRLGRFGSASAATTVLALVLCLAVAGPLASGRLWQALTPRLPVPAPAVIQLQAWIVPPRTTGLPPIFLRAGDSGLVAAPAGAQLFVSVTGGERPPVLVLGDDRTPFRRLDRASFQAVLTLSGGGRLEVWRRHERIAQWRLAVAPDHAPVIALMDAASVAGKQLRVPWRADDDYGLASVTAEFHLRDRPADPPLLITMTIPGLPRSAKGGMLPDLTAHPWAGLAVSLRYLARDGGGQRGVSGAIGAVLPERSFANPLARALIGVRRGLVLAPDRSKPAVTELDHLAGATTAQLSSGPWLNLRAIASLLVQQPLAAAEAEARLWQLAVQIEDAGVADAKQRLAQARGALHDALAAPTSAAQQRQIEALTRQLQQAMTQYLQAMQQQATQAGQSPPQPADGRSLDAKQLEQMAKQMAAAAKAGRVAEAQQRLAQLGALLDSLRAGRTLAGQGQAADKPDPVLGKLLKDQNALKNHTDQRLSNDADPRISPTPGRDPDEAAGQPDAAAERKTDGQAQGTLRERLGALAQQRGEQTGAVPDGMARADAAMRDAQAALGRGDDAGARAAQQRAMEGLQASNQQPGQSGEGQASAQARPGTDPLGRPLSEGGTAPDETDAGQPVAADAASSRALRDELRRRAADRTRPMEELQYIDRLLKSD